MRALVVYCHPDPNSLVAAARDRALAGLASAGHEVRVNDLYADGFEPVMSASERLTHKEPGVSPALERYAADLQWAQALVLVYPTWWSGQPAMLKGWMDRVWVAGVAWELPPGADVLEPRLTNVRRIVVVTTHGSSKLINAIEGESGKRTATRSLASDVLEAHADDVVCRVRPRHRRRREARAVPRARRAHAVADLTTDADRQAELSNGSVKSKYSASFIISMKSLKPSISSGGGSLSSPSRAAFSLVK